MPYHPGDLIQFQTRFRDAWNADPESPTDGWNEFIIARLVNSATGEILSEDVTEFASRYLVGWERRGSYQLLEVDTALPIFSGVDCWHLEYEARRLNGENDVTIISTGCTEEFCSIQNCDDYPLVQPIYNRFDGYGYWYGSPDAYVGSEEFKFQPEYRFPIDVIQTGGEIETQKSGDNLTAIRTSEVHIVETTERVPPYVFNLWLKMILPAISIDIDGIRYKYRGSGISRGNSGSEMFVFSLNLYRDEEITETC